MRVGRQPHATHVELNAHNSHQLLLRLAEGMHVQCHKSHLTPQRPSSGMQLLCCPTLPAACPCLPEQSRCKACQGAAVLLSAPHAVFTAVLVLPRLLRHDKEKEEVSPNHTHTYVHTHALSYSEGPANRQTRAPSQAPPQMQ